MVLEKEVGVEKKLLSCFRVNRKLTEIVVVAKACMRPQRLPPKWYALSNQAIHTPTKTCLPVVQFSMRLWVHIHLNYHISPICYSFWVSVLSSLWFLTIINMDSGLSSLSHCMGLELEVSLVGHSQKCNTP